MWILKGKLQSHTRYDNSMYVVLEVRMVSKVVPLAFAYTKFYKQKLYRRHRYPLFDLTSTCMKFQSCFDTTTLG